MQTKIIALLGRLPHRLCFIPFLAAPYSKPFGTEVGLINLKSNDFNTAQLDGDITLHAGARCHVDYTPAGSSEGSELPQSREDAIKIECP